MTWCFWRLRKSSTWSSQPLKLGDRWQLRTAFKLISNVGPYFSLSRCFHAEVSLLVFIHTQTDAEATLLTSQCPTIVALTKGCTSAKVVRDNKDIPAGCGSAVLTPTITVHVLVRVSRDRMSKCVYNCHSFALLCRDWWI